MRKAVVRLHELSHRRIGFVNGAERYSYTSFRLQGYLEGLEQCGLKPDASLVTGGAVTTDEGRKAALALLELERPPTAIVYAVDMSALGLYQAADTLGLQVGRDVSVISYDGIPEGLFAKPSLTTFAVNRGRAGERLATQLIKRICGASPESQRECEAAELVERGSDRPPIRNSEELAAFLRETVQQQSTIQRS